MQHVLSTLLTMIVVSSITVGAPPADEQVRDAIDTYKTRWKALFDGGSAKMEDVEELQSHALDDLDPAELTPRQIGMLYRANMLENEAIREAVTERIEQFTDDESTEGAVARILRLTLVGGVTDPDNRPEPELQEKLLGAAFAHPSLSEAIRGGEASFVIKAMYSLAKKSVWRAYKEEMYAMADDLCQSADHRIAYDFEDYFGILGYINEEGAAQADDKKRQEIRAALVDYGRDVLAKAETGELEIDEAYREFFVASIARLDSAHAKGTFIGSEAPAMDFIWSNDDDLKSLAALQGNVVILDFWATWCGPCVASIPDVRGLQARYEGYPVRIIGVTSIQGTHYGPDGAVKCEDDPEKEMSLMAEYIDQKDITWTIAFAEQEVFNPDYGVRGIPHVTIIAPDGTVRFNDLHPADPLPEKAAKIDALLREFDLPVPAPLPEEPEDEADEATSGA